MTTSQVADAGTALMGFLGGFCAVIFLLIFFYVVFEFVNLLICVGGTVKTFVRRMLGIKPAQSGATKRREELDEPQIENLVDWTANSLYWRSSASRTTVFELDWGEMVYVGRVWRELAPVIRSAVHFPSLDSYSKSDALPAQTNTQYSSLNLPGGELSMVNSTMYRPTSETVPGGGAG